jgi:hypothetical protein
MAQLINDPKPHTSVTKSMDEIIHNLWVGEYVLVNILTCFLTH